MGAMKIDLATGHLSPFDIFVIRLHKRVIDAVQDHHRCQAQWKSLICKALYLEDIELAEATRQLPPKWTTIHTLDSSATSKPKSSGFLGSNYQLPHSTRFLWHVTLKRPLYLTFGIICAMMTGMIVWSECTFFVVYPQLSLAARILHNAAHGYHYKYIQMCAILIIFYLGCNASLSPNCTDVLEFFGMVHLDSHITSDAKFGVETQFTKLMGHLDVIPLLAKGINIYLPILIVLLCLGTWFRLGTRLLHSLGIDQFLDEDDMTGEMVQGGKALVTLERNRINRERGREERNRAWTNNKSSTTNKDSYEGKSANTRLAMEYSDREPILEHQENNGLIEEFEANNISLEAAENESFLFSNTSSETRVVYLLKLTWSLEQLLAHL
uniref:Uncharacterized protein n=1 Tax=Ditylenchus dipsaci TaxID=166011 RepID=A0A915E2T7_9BILA